MIHDDGIAFASTLDIVALTDGFDWLLILVGVVLQWILNEVMKWFFRRKKHVAEEMLPMTIQNEQ